jgi:hypothetical protein
MRPLKDHDSSSASPIEADAADLLRAAVRYDPAPGQKQRVRARILAYGTAAHRGLRFRPSVVAGVVLFGAVASAAAGRHWIAAMVESPAGKSDSGKPDNLPASRIVLEQRTVDRIATASEGPNADETAGGKAAPRADRISPPERRTIAPRVSSAGASARVAARGGAGVRNSPPASRRLSEAKTVNIAGQDLVEKRDGAAAGTPPAERARRSDDSSLVFDAVHALRQDGAPIHALELLQEYSQLHPRGPLSEEVLALSIEAATMCRDPRAQALIDQYLSRYPTGHFRAAVETARARLSP